MGGMCRCDDRPRRRRVAAASSRCDRFMVWEHHFSAARVCSLWTRKDTERSPSRDYCFRCRRCMEAGQGRACARATRTVIVVTCSPNSKKPAHSMRVREKCWQAENRASNRRARRAGWPGRVV